LNNQYLRKQTQERHLKMNNQNSLIPHGSALEQKDQGRKRVKIAVFFVLAIHGIGLMALLMQGCGQSKEPAPPSETTATNPPPDFIETNNVATTASNPPVVVATTPTPAVVPETPTTPAAPAGATEHTIVKGDYLEKLAKDFHTTVKAITNANPGIEPTKLKIGQKILIPAPATAAGPAATGVAPAESVSATGEHIYTVKSGDNLTKIAAKYGVTLKALRAANGLKTDSIKVGQKLNIPAKTSVPATAPAPAAEPVPTAPAPAAPGETPR
jgi:LysM repeat protein